MYTAEQARACVATITPDRTLFLLNHRNIVVPSPADNKPPTYYIGEYKPGNSFASFRHPSIQLEIQSPDGITICTFGVLTLKFKPTTKIIGILLISINGIKLPPSLMLISAKCNEPEVPTNSIFLVSNDPGIYFKDMVPDDQIPGSSAKIRGVNLTKQDITKLIIAKIASNIFVSGPEKPEQ